MLYSMQSECIDVLVIYVLLKKNNNNLCLKVYKL